LPPYPKLSVGQPTVPPVTRAQILRRTASDYSCVECGATTVRWLGRCPECQAWGTLLEKKPGAPAGSAQGRAPVRTAARAIGELDASTAQPRPTGVTELDRVLGGGLVPGSVVLLAGEPGIGKSTLLLDVAHRYARDSECPALIVTGEESTSQVRLRAERTRAAHPSLFLAAENELGAVLSHIDEVQPGLVVVDSVQTISAGGVDSAAGSIAQVRAVTGALIAVAKERGIATVVVGHVTKDGSVAGPRVLEHLVDVVLHFDGEQHSPLRLIRATKNRYGAADEIGCFEMREDGIVGLPDPSRMFLSERAHGVAGTCVTVTIEGRRPLVTEVQGLVVPSPAASPRRAVTGLDSARVGMLIAVLTRHIRYRLAEREVYASTVGGMPATEPAADLAIAMALASAERELALSPRLVAIGEVSLSGDLRRVSGLDRRLAEAARLGFTTALVPASHAGEPVSVRSSGIESIPVATLSGALAAAAALPQRAPPPRRPTLRPVAGGG
jgi:DNA repair protein RadA/Sms